MIAKEFIPELRAISFAIIENSLASAGVTSEADGAREALRRALSR
jgi:hypothetical protein